MPCKESYKEHIEYTFNAFCRVVIRYAAINAWRDRDNRKPTYIKTVSGVGWKFASGKRQTDCYCRINIITPVNPIECKGENRMEKLMYMMMIEKSKTYNKMTKQVVMEHVENIRKLDDEGKLEICGVFKGYPGMAGMYILKTESREEAEDICKSEPLVMGGYATCKLVGLQIANRGNNYLL